MLRVLKKKLNFKGILTNNVIFSHIINISSVINQINPCSQTYCESIQGAEKLTTERNQQINIYAFNRLLHFPFSFKLCMSICFLFFCLLESTQGAFLKAARDDTQVEFASMSLCRCIARFVDTVLQERFLLFTTILKQHKIKKAICIVAGFPQRLRKY